jgi:hypothetical protein
MRARVVLERDRGQFRVSHERDASCTGDLHLTYRSSRNRRVPVLQLIGAARQWPSLYDPKLVDLSADRMRFVGYERVDNGWHLQEWICDLLGPPSR